MSPAQGAAPAGKRSRKSPPPAVEESDARSRYHVESLSRGLVILQRLSEAPGPLSLSDLAEQGGMTLTMAFRIVQTLAALGFVDKAGPAKTYKLAYRAIKLGYNASVHSDIADIARPALQRLNRETGESTFLSVLALPNVVSVVRILAPDRLHVVGRLFPAHATPEGKVLLAHLEPGTLANHAQLLPEVLVTPRRTLARDEFLRQLAEVRDQGFAVTDDELALGTRGVVAPVFGASGECIAAAALVVTRGRRTPDEIRGPLRARVVEIAAEISAHAGLHYWTRCSPP